MVSEDTFSKLLEFSKLKENLGIVGCKLIDGTGEFLPESKRNIPTPKVSFLKVLGQSKHYYANHLLEDEIGKQVYLWSFYVCRKTKTHQFKWI